MEALKSELKEQIIEQLSLEEVEVADIKDDEPLFGEGLGLDSIDALELIVLLDKYHGIKIDDPEKARDIFHSVNTMSAYIAANK